MYISSTSNEKIKFLASLKKKSVREESGLILLEGERLICDSKKWGAEIVSVFCREGYEGVKIDCEECYTLSEKAFEKVSETVNSQGIIAVAKKREGNIFESGKKLCILCDNVRDPGNMGTIIRLSHAAGAALLISDGCVDVFGPKCVRASMGGVFACPPHYFSEKVLDFLKNKGYTFYAGMLHRDSASLFDTDFAEKAVIVVGNEGDGVSEKIAQLCDKFIQIPMPGGAESLNVSAAAGIMIYEYMRQMSLR